MQIEYPNFLIKIYFVNIKQTTQLQLVPEDKVAILRYGSRISGVDPLPCMCNYTWLQSRRNLNLLATAHPRHRIDLGID